MPNEPPVLVLESDDAIQRLLEIVLRRDGYVPVFVRDGRAAVRQSTERQFDLFIVDVTIARACSKLDLGAASASSIFSSVSGLSYFSGRSC